VDKTEVEAPVTENGEKRGAGWVRGMLKNGGKRMASY